MTDDGITASVLLTSQLPDLPTPNVRVSYHEGYVVPLPPEHPFPMAKFDALHRLVRAEGLASEVMTPREADWADLLLVHTRDYLDRLASGTMSRAEVRRMGLPWSPALVRRSRLAVQGTINAAFAALHDGLAGNLAGGTHHAMPDHAEGFCVLNDVAVALRVLDRARWIRRALIVDLDVHQGNGNAAFFADDDSVFTFSMHGERNYPFHKPPSDLDVPLPDGTADDEYLDALTHHLPVALDRARPDLVVYLGGIDVLDGDRFGRLALTRSGLRERERFVLDTLHVRAGLPVVQLLSGGYARSGRLTSPEATADLHAEQFRAAHALTGGIRKAA